MILRWYRKKNRHCCNFFQRTLLQRTSQEVNAYMARHLFIVYLSFLKVGFWYIVMTILGRLVTSLRSVMSTLMMAYRDALYNQCLSNTWQFSIFIFPTGRIRVCEIRFASTGVICGNPYPVCKNVVSFLFSVKYRDFSVKSKPIISLFQTMKLRLGFSLFGITFFLPIEFPINSGSKTSPKDLT